MNTHIVSKIFKQQNLLVEIYNITLKEADEYQAELLIKIVNFKKKAKPGSPEKKRKKNVLENLDDFFECREKVFDAFES